ncbi:PKD domain-containing protein [Spirosoma flavum]|uniref:PKD domain-containing protein n=1 Tax=Spirosoma flavum TaxID=2048557 RepID=A0ABW6AMV0_9BACT
MKTWLLRFLNALLLITSITVLTDCKKEEEAVPKPAAHFSYYPSTNLVAPVTLQFSNDSKNVDSYVWSYDGTGRTLTSENIALSFSQGGTYTITLAATGKGGTDTYAKTITVTDSPTNTTKPIAEFTYSPSSNLVAPANITFTNLSTNGTSFKWDFGDGSTSLVSSPTKQFTKDGTYTVKLTATGTSGSSEVSKNITVGKVNSAPAVGKAVFWATGTFSYVVISTEEVIFDEVGGGKTLSFAGGRIEKPFTSQPACDAANAYSTRRPVGKYTYTAIAYDVNGIRLASGSGDYTVVANGCTSVKLDFTAATAIGQVVFWTDKSSGWSSIDVTVSGSSVGNVTGYATSVPACGTSKAVTVTRSPGTYPYTATSNTGVKWSGNITVTANQCNTKQLEFPATANCDWAAWNKLATVVTFVYNTNFCADGQTLTTVRNDATVNMDMQFCIQKADGTWQTLTGLNTRPGGYLIGPNYYVCGRAKGYKFWARPTSQSATCPYPEKCN